MRVLATVAVSIALAVEGQAQFASAYPMRAASPSGEWVLTVDATNRWGNGAGSFRMEQSGELEWEAELPFTFAEAAVTDDGVTAGYADGAGERHNGTLHAVIDEDGVFRFRDVHEPEIPKGGPLNAGPDSIPRRDPTPFRLLLDPANDRVIFRWAKKWYVHRLSDGALTHEGDPLAITPQDFESGSVQQRGWCVVPDTELVLADWSPLFSSEEERSVDFMLVDRDLRIVWNWSVPAAGPLTDEQKHFLSSFDELGTQIIDVGPGGAFTIAVLETGERIVFRAVRDERMPSGWRVDEIGRRTLEVAPLDNWAQNREWAEQLPKFELQLLARVTLRSGGDASASDRELVSTLPGELHSATADSLGRLLLRDKLTGAIHGFDANGVQVLVARPSPGDLELRGASLVDRTPPAVSSAGDLFLTWRIAKQDSAEVRVLHFAPDGRRIGLEPKLGLDRWTEHWFFQPSAPRRWVVTRRLHWIDDATGERREYERGPDGRWFGVILSEDVGVGVDGSLALLTQTRDERGRQTDCVHLFGADGEPLRTLLLDERRYGTWLFLYTGDHLLFPGVTGEWIVLDLTGAPIARYVVAGLPEGVGHSALLSRGRELWVVAEARELWRFALPPGNR